MRNDYTEKKTLNSEIYLEKCFISCYNESATWRGLS